MSGVTDNANIDSWTPVADQPSHRTHRTRGIVLQIDLLGTVTVTEGGCGQEVGANKVRVMLAVLALEAGTAISHVELAEELWAGQRLRNPRNALQAHATRLRRILRRGVSDPSAPALRAVRNGYRLDIPRDYVDAYVFMDLAARGAAALATDPGRALELLQAGLRLWRGPALVDARDGLRCRSAAMLFDERRLATWEDLVTALLAVGDTRRAIAELRRLVANHPSREGFCDQLMLSLYRSDRQVEALDVYHRTRQHLDDELGIMPGPSLQRRYEQILAHDPDLLAAAPLVEYAG
jgi:DNA-binding SARP family transcriptional activator